LYLKYIFVNMIVLGFTSSSGSLCEKISNERLTPQTYANLFFRNSGEWPDLIVEIEQDEKVKSFKIDVDYTEIDI
jgi:hypothetical protein